MYTRTLEPMDRRSLPPQMALRGVTSFPASGSVHVHMGGPADKAAENAATKLPYTVSRPQADWTFQRAGEQVQVVMRGGDLYGRQSGKADQRPAGAKNAWCSIACWWCW